MPSFGPFGEHQLAIALEVDKLAARSELSPAAIPEILAFLDFALSSADAAFLDRYIQWRIENPILKL